MTTSLAIMLIFGLAANALFSRIKLPGLLGMLLLGVLTGPYVLNWLDTDTLKLSADFRKMALIVILLRAGLGIHREDLKKVGAAAMKLAVFPGFLKASPLPASQ